VSGAGDVVAATARRVAGALGRSDVLLYTSRAVVPGRDTADGLAIVRSVSAALAGTVRAALAAKPAWVIAKGGITSHDVAVQGLGIRPASVPFPGPGREPVMPGTARDDRPDVGDDPVADDVVGVIAVHGARRIPGHQRHRVAHRQR
jgi:uncharacterized protein YgbK (DUF1537 family)